MIVHASGHCPESIKSSCYVTEAEAHARMSFFYTDTQLRMRHVLAHAVEQLPVLPSLLLCHRCFVCLARHKHQVDAAVNKKKTVTGFLVA